MVVAKSAWQLNRFWIPDTRFLFHNRELNSGIPDQTPHSVTSHLGLHWLHMSHKKDAGLICVKLGLELILFRSIIHLFFCMHSSLWKTGHDLLCSKKSFQLILIFSSSLYRTLVKSA